VTAMPNIALCVAGVALASVAVGCRGGGVEAGGGPSVSVVSAPVRASGGVLEPGHQSGSVPSVWACRAPSTFTPVGPPPDAPGVPQPKSTPTAREYADAEVGRFKVAPTVVEVEQSSSQAVFRFVGEEAMLVGEVTVIRRDDGRWILSALKSCRDLERPA